MTSRGFDLGALRLFIEVARSGSLTSAGQNLGLSQPAISYQIRQLESEIGSQLFYRQHRGVELTPSGRLLFETATKSLLQIDNVVRNIREQPSHHVRIFTDYAFSALWLLPRLQKIREKFPAIDLEVIANQQLKTKEPVNTDIYILFGTERDYGENGILLMPERVAPVCSPAFAHEYGAFYQPHQLLNLPILHLEAEPNAAWYTWSGYFTDQNHNCTRNWQAGSSQYNTYTLVLQAALVNAGVAIGWLDLIDAYLSKGELITVGPQLVREDRGYWLIINKHLQDSHDNHLKDWILQEIHPLT